MTRLLVACLVVTAALFALVASRVGAEPLPFDASMQAPIAAPLTVVTAAPPAAPAPSWFAQLPWWVQAIAATTAIALLLSFLTWAGPAIKNNAFLSKHKPAQAILLGIRDSALTAARFVQQTMANAPPDQKLARAVEIVKSQLTGANGVEVAQKFIGLASEAQLTSEVIVPAIEAAVPQVKAEAQPKVLS